jgi:hypothetical protein
MAQQQIDGSMKTYDSYPCTIIPSTSKYFVAINISWVDRNLKSIYEVRAHCFSAHELKVRANMTDEPACQMKRLLTGARVSGAFRDFYDNPDPNIRRQKRQRIYGTVVGACGERKYTVQFDCGHVVDCFPNTLPLKKSTALPPPVEIQAAISEE